MEQNPPSKSDSRLSGQEITHFLFNPKVHYCDNSSLPPPPTLNEMNPLHRLPPRFLKISFNIILPSKLMCGFFSSGFPTKRLHIFLICPMYSPQTHPPWKCYAYTNIICRIVQIMELIIWTFLQPPVTSFLLGLDVSLASCFQVLFLTLRSLNVRVHLHTHTKQQTKL
jgi:hypothetical protein